MRISEIFFSIQGESSHAGKPCVFVRLTGCSLRCTWCDTTYSYSGGQELSQQQVLEAVARHPVTLVEITGGEPLEQEAAYPLMEALLQRDYMVMLETGGHIRIDRVPREVIKIIDIKCPDSGEPETFCWDNIALVMPQDEFKFVIASERDYAWSREVIRNRMKGISNVMLFSPAHAILPLKDLAEWVLRDGLQVRVQPQLHKYIWGTDARGV